MLLNENDGRVLQEECAGRVHTRQDVVLPDHQGRDYSHIQVTIQQTAHLPRAAEEPHFDFSFPSSRSGVLALWLGDRHRPPRDLYHLLRHPLLRLHGLYRADAGRLGLVQGRDHRRLFPRHPHLRLGCRRHRPLDRQCRGAPPDDPRLDRRGLAHAGGAQRHQPSRFLSCFYTFQSAISCYPS